MMITIIGILCGLLVYVLFSPARVRRGEASLRLAEMYSLETSRSLSEMNPQSLEYQLLASGIRLQPITFRLVTFGLGLAMGIVSWPLLPGIPALAVGVIAVLLPYAWLDGRVKGRGLEIDRLLPVAIGRITAGLLAGGAVPEVLQKTAESLEVEGPNPLTPELLLTAAELRSKERKQALRALAARSPSNSLGNLAYLLEGYSDSGGGKYTEVLFQTSQRVQQILVSRNRAVAKAADALTSARIIPLVLLVVFVFLTRDPLIHEALSALSVQAVIAFGIGMMVLGYVLIRSIVAEAV